MQSLSLAIGNSLPEVGRMSRWLAEAMRQMDLPEESRFRLDLCASEAVTNIISYGFPDHGQHEISVRLAVNGTEVTLEIEDDGVSFNLLEAPEPMQPASLDEARIGGLGIPLIRRLMHRCSYERLDGKNLLRMSISFTGLDSQPV